MTFTHAIYRTSTAGYVALMTAVGILISLSVTLVLNVVLQLPDASTNLLMATIMPAIITPWLSYSSAVSIRALVREREKAAELALRDFLTGLFNRRAFFQMVATRMDVEAPAPARHAVLFMDIDHFKQINDRYGHDAGDAVLEHFAHLLKEATRSEDRVARIGGEEFVAHVTDKSIEQLSSMAHRICERVRRVPAPFADQSISYTVSIGVAAAPSTIPIGRLLAAADAQLYAAKDAGRDRVALSEMGDASIPSSPLPLHRAALHVRSA